VNAFVQLGGDDDLARCVTQQADGALSGDSKSREQDAHVDECSDAGPERAGWDVGG
jgi:hypothetical protein